MYNLYKLDENKYQIHSQYSNETSMEGTLLAILTYCVHTLRFDPDELEIDLLDMLKNDFNAAKFGLNRTVIYCFNHKRKAG